MMRFVAVCLVLLVGAVSLPAVDAGVSEAGESVRYRCVKWKAKHIHDAKKAEVIVKTLKQLKCEVKRHAHGDHEDVQYRCAEWKTLQVKTHDDAHKWEKWLKEFGFETEHKH